MICDCLDPSSPRRSEIKGVKKNPTGHVETVDEDAIALEDVADRKPNDVSDNQVVARHGDVFAIADHVHLNVLHVRIQLAEEGKNEFLLRKMVLTDEGDEANEGELGKTRVPASSAPSSSSGFLVVGEPHRGPLSCCSSSNQ